MDRRTFIRFECAPELEERVAGRLVLAGSLGWETKDAGGRLVVEADFEAGAGGRLAPLAEWLSSSVGASVELFEDVPQPDWIEVSARGLEPFDVGRRLWVDPSPREGGADRAAPPDRLALRMPPERAFGTGTHESTRLLLEDLDGRPPAGLSVLDVGTGSAILALAAAGLGATRAVAFDDDAEAVFCARRNVREHHLTDRVALFAGRLDALSLACRFDLVLANITPETLIELMPGLAARVEPAGRLLLSGIVEERAEDVARAAQAAGLGEMVRTTRGAWVALDLARPRA